MARIYCAYSRRLNERLDLVRSDLLIVKFGLSSDVQKRLDSMKNGWLIEGGGRGPALASEDDWRLVDYPGAKRWIAPDGEVTDTARRKADFRGRGI